MLEDDIAQAWERNAETWTRQSRAGYDIYRDAVNTPAFLAMLPPVDGLDGLDIGCGEGTNTRSVARLGARLKAIDISPTFIRHARETESAEPLGIEFGVGDALALPFADGSFDFATAFMCLMDVRDPAKALLEIGRVLKSGGFVQFSILHPCFAPPYRKVVRDDAGRPKTIEVADYFAAGMHSEKWWFSKTDSEERERVAPFEVIYCHMPLAKWIDCLMDAGLVLWKLGEPSVSDETLAGTPEVADLKVAPLFLHLLARKRFEGE